MKVVYAGVFRDSTGWGRAAQDYILSLDAVGVDVVPRAVKLNDRQVKLPERITELEQKSSRGSDVVIQHVLPHLMDHNGKLLNIGLYASETSHFKSSSWADRINCMDKAVVINHQMARSARGSGVTIPISVVPHACDITRFQRSYETLEPLKPYKERGEFLFYFVGEMVRRKGLAFLLKAFHLEFDPSEPVQLVIKTDKPGLSAEQCRQNVITFCNEIKRGLKLHGGHLESYKEEIVLTDRLSDEGINRLHYSCDCHVMPSYGEAWGLGVFDSMAFGKTPIVTACTGFLDYVSDEVGWLVNCRDEPVFGESDTFGDLFVGDESWSAVDVNHLRHCMREAFAKDSLREEKATNGIARAYDFSYEAVGLKLKKAIENVETVAASSR